MSDIQRILTPNLTVAFEQHGPSNGDAVVLLHGFPYSPRAYDEIAPVLAAEGYRVIVPYLRGYGPTRFNHPETLRSGQQAALAQDLLELMNALGIEHATLCGYDWGGRAACIVAALFPERVRGLVTGMAITCRTSPIRPGLWIPRPSTVIGTSTISTRLEASRA